MTRARKHLICLSDTPYYHITSRCVRRAFLCGEDRHTGRSYKHRRDWVEQRIRILSSVFSINICAYAIMSNHYHLVAHVDRRSPINWSGREVLERWTTLFKGPILVRQYLAGENLSDIEHQTLVSTIEVLRQRLSSLSWFMKCLNEFIARQANAEDGCTGHFWEARFHSQALRTEQALLAAMAYVDLNPVRAGIAATPESSDYTSIKARLEKSTHGTLKPLLPFANAGNESAGPTDGTAIPCTFPDYLVLLDASSRARSHPGKRAIEPRLPSILARLGMTDEGWQTASTEFRHIYRTLNTQRNKAA